MSYVRVCVCARVCACLILSSFSVSLPALLARCPTTLLPTLAPLPALPLVLLLLPALPTATRYARMRASDAKYHSPFSYAAIQAGYVYLGGKMDDITVLVSYVALPAAKL